MIRLTCPSCKSELMIDEGFRGGVCRCFSCGTLMTVPEDPDHQQAESLTRPEAPSGPSTRTGTFARTGTFRTSSGRTVELSTRDLSRIPIAKKRRPGVRAAVYILVSLILLSLIAFVGYGVSMVVKHKPGDIDTQQVYTDVFGIADNPFLADRPQFMGAPLTGTTVLMTDGSASMRDSLDYVKRAIEVAVQNGGASPVQVVIWSERAPMVHPAAPAPARDIDKAALKGKLEEVLPEGGLAAGPAFAAAMQSKPTQVILVARDVPDDEELKSIHTQLKAAGAKLNVVQIADEPNAALANIAKETGGKLLTISAGQLRRWHDEYLAKSGG